MNRQSKNSDLLARMRSGAELSTPQQLSLIVRLSIPAILAQISSIIMQYIDASMIGRLSPNDGAAIGLVSSSTWLLGGLGSAVAEALASGCPAPVEFVGMKDEFGKSGGYAELSAHFKMDAVAIADAVKRVIARK